MESFPKGEIKMSYRSFCHYLGIALLGILLIILISCPPPLTNDMLVPVKDEVGPQITILSPEDGNTYASAVVVEGIVTDSSDSEDTAGGINRGYYEFSPTAINGADVDVGEDGTFFFQFFTAKMSEVTVYGTGSILPVSVEMYGSYAFVTDYLNGLYILEVSNPASPVELNHLDAGGLKVIDLW